MIAGRACDLCGETKLERISERDRLGKPLATVVCSRCGLVSHAAIPSDGELAAVYAGEYRYEYHGSYVPAAYRVVREWKRGQHLVRQLQDEVAPGERVFEVGAGLGCTVMNFALAGYDASGIEPGEGFRNYSVEKLRARIEAGYLEDVPPRKQYECVLLVHVLEHLPSPTLALRQIRNLLRPKGKLYIEVPNLAAPHAAPGKQFHYAHIYNFTPATLRMLAAKTGFVIKRAYTAPFDRIIGFLIEASDTAYLRIEPQSYSQTMAALRRYNTFTYHARPHYVAQRLATVADHLSDRWEAKRKLEAIVSQCEAHEYPALPLRRAA
jgi:2-polyprenyl-3-methyl-5-hydroxy-6-metoxy-1,4-benzoquinol methylase